MTPITPSQRIAGALVVLLGVGILWYLWTNPVNAMSGRRGPAMPLIAPMIVVLGLALALVPTPAQPPPGQRSGWAATPPAWKAVLIGGALAGIVHMFIYHNAFG